jgi:hypothetical protein
MRSRRCCRRGEALGPSGQQPRRRGGQEEEAATNCRLDGAALIRRSQWAEGNAPPPDAPSQLVASAPREPRRHRDLRGGPATRRIYVIVASVEVEPPPSQLSAVVEEKDGGGGGWGRRWPGGGDLPLYRRLCSGCRARLLSSSASAPAWSSCARRPALNPATAGAASPRRGRSLHGHG